MLLNNFKIVSILGMVGQTKPDYIIENESIKKIFVKKEEKDKAKYTFGPRLIKEYSLKRGRYINTLPILCELFDPENIVPIYTDQSKKVQKDVLQYECIPDLLLENPSGYIVNDKDFSSIFEVINNILRESDKIIIDITHGFRHLPILTTISLIMENIKNIHKIEHIFFAKEVVPQQEYEIIDLKEYLDVANISFVLAGFRENYTISHHIKCVDPQYQEIIDLLSQFSEHILSNSIIELIESEDSLTNRILQRLENIEKSKTVGLDSYINGIKLHLKRMNAYAKLPKEIQLYEMAKMLSNKGYYLNAITLLDEAIGYYCVSKFKMYSPEIEEHIQRYLAQNNVKKSLNYELTNTSKTLVKKLEELNGGFLTIPKIPQLSKESQEEDDKNITSFAQRLKKIPDFILQLEVKGYEFKLNKLGSAGKGKPSNAEKKRRSKEREKIKEYIPDHIQQELLREEISLALLKKEDSNKKPNIKSQIIKNLKEKNGLITFQDFIEETDNLRNNLAHANSSDPLVEIKERMKYLLETFNKFCIDKDVLS